MIRSFSSFCASRVFDTPLSSASKLGRRSPTNPSVRLSLVGLKPVSSVALRSSSSIVTGESIAVLCPFFEGENFFWSCSDLVRLDEVSVGDDTLRDGDETLLM